MKKNNSRENHVTNVIFLLLPIILLSAAIIFATELVFNEYVRKNSLVMYATTETYEYGEDETLPLITDFVYTEPVTETEPESETEAVPESETETEGETKKSAETNHPSGTKAPETTKKPETETKKKKNERTVLATLSDPTAPNLTYTSEEFPVIYYDTCWAVMNVEGWSKRNINIYYGDSEDILAKGAGLWIGSGFCGQNSKVVLSAHVMSYFYALEVTEPGTKITITTSYGTYIYEVSEKIVFYETDYKILRDEKEGDVLFMYTCYPRTVGLKHTETRCALKCRLIEGCVYEDYLN